MKRKLEDLVYFYKSLSVLTRLEILAELLDKDKCVCVCDLASKLNKHFSVIYKHIQILKKQGLVDTYKEKNSLFTCIKNKELCEKVLYFK